MLPLFAPLPLSAWTVAGSNPTSSPASLPAGSIPGATTRFLPTPSTEAPLLPPFSFAFRHLTSFRATAQQAFVRRLLYTYCENPSNGQVVACNISLSTTYYQYRNGHFHSNPPPPVSSISPSSGYTGSYSNWQIPVTLTTTQVGQIEALYISDDDNGDVVHYDYGVGYLGLVYIDNSNVFYQTGGNTTNHGDNTWNHYMTVNAATGLQNAATFYINSYNPGQKVCINDMALPIGGKFDIHDDWQSPHISHDQGTAADVAAAAGQCPGSYIVNLNTFRQACINVGHSLSANTITEGNHVHCRWPN